MSCIYKSTTETPATQPELLVMSLARSTGQEIDAVSSENERLPFAFPERRAEVCQ